MFSTHKRKTKDRKRAQVIKIYQNYNNYGAIVIAIRNNKMYSARYTWK